MNLLAIVLVHNAFDVARESITLLDQHTSPDSLICVVDNASRTPLKDEPWMPKRVTVLRYEENFGNYPVFHSLFDIVGLDTHEGKTYGLVDNLDILAFLHSDLMIYEKHWDLRVIEEMEKHKIDLAGVVGSSEIGEDGGRGLGTASNFQGTWPGTGDAIVHGKRCVGTMPAAVVDGCAMIFRRTMLEKIGHREDFPPHHFYDRLMSCQVLEAGGRVAVIGITCDHRGGQTSVKEPGWDATAEKWCRAHGLNKPHDGGWDLAIYREAERQFLEEYRDRKHLIPVRVNGEWGVER